MRVSILLLNFLFLWINVNGLCQDIPCNAAFPCPPSCDGCAPAVGLSGGRCRPTCQDVPEDSVCDPPSLPCCRDHQCVNCPDLGHWCCR